MGAGVKILMSSDHVNRGRLSLAAARAAFVIFVAVARECREQFFATSVSRKDQTPQLGRVATLDLRHFCS